MSRPPPPARANHTSSILPKEGPAALFGFFWGTTMTKTATKTAEAATDADHPASLL
jgi:hypothetical protein